MISLNVDYPTIIGVKATLLLTLYTKAMDSRSDNPILNDKKADEIVRQLKYDFGRLKVPQKEIYGGAIRSKLLDDCVANFLLEYPNAIVLDLGCGLDARAERVGLSQSVQWYDIDYADVIELRKQFFKEAKNYHMIGASLTDLAWLDQIPGDDPAIVVADGLIPFLTTSDLKELFKRIVDHFPHGELVFNNYTEFSSRLLKYHPSIKALGVAETANPGFDDLHEFERWDSRLNLKQAISIVGSPYVAQANWSYRATCSLMYHVPLFRKEGGWILNYQFK